MLNLGRTLSALLSRSHGRVQRRRSPQRCRGFRPRLEALEDRSMLTASLSVDDVYINEDEGMAIFAVHLHNAPEDEDVTVEYSTTAISATADEDYQPVSGVLTFLAGDFVYQEIYVTIIDDLITENDEVFELTLSGAVNATVDRSGLCTIAGSDQLPVLDPIGDKTVDEETELYFIATATPGDTGTMIDFSLDSGAPDGAYIDPTSGEFFWTPTEEDGPGTFEVTIRVTEQNSMDHQDWETITITVNEVNRAPTVDWIDDILVDEDSGPVYIDVYTAFEDAETFDHELMYEWHVDGDDWIFSSTSIDMGTGQIQFELTPNAYGSAQIVIRATDDHFAWVETTVYVVVYPVNDAPEITIIGEPLLDNVWVFYGYVTDVDDDPTGWTVVFGGLLEPYNLSATVDANGYYEVAIDLGDDPYGTATAQVTDPHGLESELAMDIV